MHTSKSNLPKLTIAYRIYPKVSKTPAIYQDNKFALSELCLASLIRSIGDKIDYRFIALLDNCPQEYVNLFEKYIPEDRLEIIKLQGIGNGATFVMQIDLLLKQDFSNYVYFAEDDYFYLNNEFVSMIELMENNQNVHFVTPYDHLDRYTLSLHNFKSNVIIESNKHWQNVSSTCLTFLTNKKSLSDCRSIFETYKRRNHDAAIWMTITKINSFKFGFILKCLFKSLTDKKSEEARYSYIYKKIFKFGLKRLIFGKKFGLWSPIPAISTHLEKSFLSPNIDWYQEFNKAKK